MWGTAAYIVWGAVTAYWKLLGDFRSFELIGVRIISSAVVMGLGMQLSGRLVPLFSKLRDRSILGRATLSAVLLSANWSVYVWAVVHGHVLQTALGYFITPIGLMGVGVVVLHERLEPLKQVVLALAIAAVAVLTITSGEPPTIALAIAVTWVAYALNKKQSTLDAFEGLTVETVVLLLPALALVAWSATREDNFLQVAQGWDWPLLAFTGVITAVPLLMFAVAAPRLEMTVIALLQFITPTINFLLGWLLYHEELTAGRVVGFALVWIGLALISVDSLRKATGGHRFKPS